VIRVVDLLDAVFALAPADADQLVRAAIARSEADGDEPWRRFALRQLLASVHRTAPELERWGDRQRLVELRTREAPALPTRRPPEDARRVLTIHESDLVEVLRAVEKLQVDGAHATASRLAWEAGTETERASVQRAWSHYCATFSTGVP